MFPITQSTKLAHRIALAICLTGLLGIGCADDPAQIDPNSLAGFRVELVDTSNLGESPFEFLSAFTPVTISVEAFRPDGQRKDDYHGTLQIRVVPGEVAPETRFITLEDGFNASHDVEFRYSFGNARIWVEEVGLGGVDECHDGFDNDGDGSLDYPGDPGCSDPEDPSEGTASYTTGITDALGFEPISIRAIQYNVDDLSGISPLLDEAVVIEKGSLIVTNVVLNGFYATDTDEPEGYDSIFIFNYSFPDGVRIGDKMSWIAGGVDEFQQDTQLTFPTWEHDESYQIFNEDRSAMARCEAVDNPDVIEIEPNPVTATTISNLEAMESVESALVRVENAQVSNRFLHCDFDLNGEISGVGEEACRTECQNDIYCTEWSNYLRRDQFNIVIDGAQAQVSQAFVVANFNPTEGCEVVSEVQPEEISCPDRTLASVTGTLRHVFLTSRIQLWEILPRYSCDLVFACTEDTDCPNDGICTEDICEFLEPCDDNDDCPEGSECIGNLCR